MSQSLGYPDDCVDYDSSGNMVSVPCRPDHFGDQPKAVVFTPYQRSQYGLLWKYLTRDQRDSFLSVVAAGNSGNAESASLYAGLGEAVYGSPMSVVTDDPMAHVQDESLWGIPLTLTDGDPDFVSIAANDFQLSQLQSLSDLLKLSSLGTARNVLVVGSGDRVEAHAFSSQGGNIMADGANIKTLGSESVSGTSYSAPQVAGLAAYMWAIAPELREGPMEDTVRAITANTRDNGFIDAYAAVLSIDEDAGSEPPKAPVREAILDVTGDGFFNQDDLRLFADFYGLTDTPVAEDPDNPGTPSRFDLNGDGLISPDATERFDLDPENSTHLGEARYGNVSLSIGGDTISLDENQLTDTEILCYYAYSTLYLGDEQTRSTLLPLSVCNTDANLGISNLFTKVSGHVRIRADCSLSGGVCSGRTVTKKLPPDQNQSLTVSDGYTAESSWSDGTGTSIAKASMSFSSNVIIGASNGDLMMLDFNAGLTLSANTDYPDNPNFSTITARAESSAASGREVHFTLVVPATYTASVDMSMPVRPLGSRSGASGGVNFFSQALGESLFFYDAGDQLGSQTYTGVLSPGDYSIYADCQSSIVLETVNTTTPAGESDSMSGNCTVTLNIVPSN